MPDKRNPLSYLLLATLLGFIVVCCQKQEKFPLQFPASPESTSSSVQQVTQESQSIERRSLLAFSESEKTELVEQIRAKLKPTNLVVDENNKVQPHQFLHLHHMKTGGTSIDHLLRCSRDRMTNDFNYTFPHYSIHECARKQFRNCVQDSNDACRASMDGAGTMSFCSALKYLPLFGWDATKAVTVLRHPVERVWSMYRFETRMCYKCMNLTEIYTKIDNGDVELMDSLCLAQLQNHETANLLTSDWPENASEDEIVAEAISNLKSAFTVVGLTEQLTMTAKILGTVFPWVNKTLEGSHSRCSLPHDNSSPTNNHCIKQNRTDGKRGIVTTHWDLPDHPDEVTRAAIEEHNRLDMKLYEAAVQYFELQQQAFELNEQSS